LIVTLYRNKTICYERRFNGSEILTLRKTEQKYLESFEMWCWRRIEKMSWNDRVRNELLLRGKEERNIVHAIKERESNWTGHIFRRNCLPKYLIEGKIVVTLK